MQLNRKDSRLQFVESLQYYWECPISKEIMTDPVLTCDGITYQRSAITNWLQIKNTSPITNLPLNSLTLIPNIIFRDMVNKFKNAPSFIKKQNIEAKMLEQKYVQQKMFLLKRQISALQKENIELQQQLPEKNGIIPPLYKKQLAQCHEKIKQLENRIEQLSQINAIESNEMKFNKINKLNEVKPNLIEPNYYQNPINYLQQQLRLSQLQIDSKYTIEKISNGINYFALNHWSISIKMDVFTRFNWDTLIHIGLIWCEIDDGKWRVFVNNSKTFPNLQTILIFHNKIRTVLENDLEQFQSLKRIDFAGNGGSNPLSSSSKEALRKYNQKHNLNKKAQYNKQKQKGWFQSLW